MRTKDEKKTTRHRHHHQRIYIRRIVGTSPLPLPPSGFRNFLLLNTTIVTITVAYDNMGTPPLVPQVRDAVSMKEQHKR